MPHLIIEMVSNNFGSQEYVCLRRAVEEDLRHIHPPHESILTGRTDVRTEFDTEADAKFTQLQNDVKKIKLQLKVSHHS